MPTIVVALPDEAPETVVLEAPEAVMVVQPPATVGVTIVTGLQGPPGPGAEIDLDTTKGWAYYGSDPATERPADYGSVEWAGDGNVLPENAELYDSFVDTSGEGGLLLRKLAGAAIGGHRVVVIRSDNRVEYASKDTPDHAYRVIGVTLGAAIEDDFVLIAGDNREVTEPSWAWTPNVQLFLSTGGLLTETAPTSGFLLSVATTLSATRILVRPQFPVFL